MEHIYTLRLVREYKINGQDCDDSLDFTSSMGLSMLRYKVECWCKRNGIKIIAKTARKLGSGFHQIPENKYMNVWYVSSLPENEYPNHIE